MQGIAAGLFGKTIIGNEIIMALIGLVLHYIIALCFAAGYFFVFPNISFLKNHKLISGLLYGIFVWAVMNLIVLPLSSAYHGSFTWLGFFRGVVILMLCIGLPISFITAKYYAQKANNKT